MDKAHEDVCGPAVVHLLKRAYTLSDDVRYERLVDLSSSHLYNLRKSSGYYQNRPLAFGRSTGRPKNLCPWI